MSNSKKRAAEDAAPAKKAKKRKAKHAVDDENLDTELGLNTLFSKMDSQLLADYHAQKLARFGTDLSPVELSDLALSGVYKRHLASAQLLKCSLLISDIRDVAASSITDTTSWQETRSLEKLPDFLEKFSEHPESLSRAQKKNGMPHTIIVAGAGLRAADLTRFDVLLSLNPLVMHERSLTGHLQLQSCTKILRKRQFGRQAGELQAGCLPLTSHVLTGSVL